MSHAFRLASLIAACVIPLATAAAAHPLNVDQRFQGELDARLEAKLNKLLEAKLDSQTAELFARNPQPAAGGEIPAIADSAHLATHKTRAVGGSGTLDCVAAPVCDSDEVERPTVVASGPPSPSSPTTACLGGSTSGLRNELASRHRGG